MPIYEYKCSACETTFEKMVKVADPIPPCPECGAEEVKKLVSAAGFVLKGSGWYKDHYGLKSSKKDSGSKSEKKSEAKPASSKGSGSSDG